MSLGRWLLYRSVPRKGYTVKTALTSVLALALIPTLVVVMSIGIWVKTFVSIMRIFTGTYVDDK